MSINIDKYERLNVARNIIEDYPRHVCDRECNVCSSNNLRDLIRALAYAVVGIIFIVIIVLVVHFSIW